LVLDQLIDVSETSTGKHNEEVIHNIGVVSLIWSTIWTDDNCVDSVDLFEFVIIIIIVNLISRTCFLFGFSDSSFFLIDFVSKSAHSEFSKSRVNIVVKLNIKLNCIDSVQITLTFLIVSTNIWDRAHCRQNLSHIVILDIAQSFFVILVTSAGKIMKIVNQRKNSSVHLH